VRRHSSELKEVPASAIGERLYFIELMMMRVRVGCKYHELPLAYLTRTANALFTSGTAMMTLALAKAEVVA